MENILKQKRIAEATKFFDQLYGKIPAQNFVYLIKFAGGIETYSFNAGAVAAMAQKAVELTDNGVDIWHSVNPVRVAPHAGKRGKEDVVSYQTAIVADIDIQSDAHKSDSLVATFDEAKALLPFAPSLIVNSGYGLHAYYIFDTPIEITDDNREEIKRRNKRLLEVIRSRANGKKIDSVDDLPRILRTPGTFNYKLDKDNAPLCHVVDDTGLRFSPADLDEKLNASTVTTTPPIEPARKLDITFDDTDLKDFRIRHMLDFINVADGDYEKWLAVGFALFNEGFDCGVWTQWSMTQPNFNVGECESKWQGFHYEPNGNTIGTLYQYAVEGGYDEKDTQREFYQLFPEKSKRRNHSSGSAQIDDLRAELQAANQQLADFDKEKDTALKKLRNLEKFDYGTVFDKDIITCAAFARCFEPSSYSELRHVIKLYRNEHSDTGVDLNDFGTVTKDRAEEIQARYDKLLARCNELKAAIRTQKFFAANKDVLAQYVIPVGYSVTATGIEKIKEKGNELVCRRPVIIKGRVFDTDKQFHNLQLCYQDASGKWHDIKPQEKAVILNARKLVELANLGLSVTSVNANALVEYLDAFHAENETRLPMTYQIPRCGWFERHGSKVFIDPRRQCSIDVGDKHITCAVSDGSEFAKHLTTKGSLKKWKEAYQLAKKSPVARAVVAAAVAAPLLDVVGERNFMLYVKARTRAGKTTAQLLGASAIGDEKIMRSFDATKNGLVGAAADVSDYAFIIDEKQVTDGRLKENLTELVYSLANGVGRTKLNRDSTLKKLHDWRVIVIGSGETDLLPENATDGADTRLLTLNAPNTILTADDCRHIRDIIKENYGLALPLVIDKVLETKEDLRGLFKILEETFAEKYPKLLSEHCRYMAIISTADVILNWVLGNVDFKTAVYDASTNAYKLLDDLPTVEDISATDREKDFVRGFVNENQNNFVGGAKAVEHMTVYYGRLDDPNFIYVTVKSLKDACTRAGFDYRKLRDDLASAEFFDTVNGKSYVKCRVGKVPAWCHRIKTATFNEDTE